MNRLMGLEKTAKLNLKQKDALGQILVSVAEVLLASWVIGPLIEAKLTMSYTVIGSLTVLLCWLVIIQLFGATK